MTYVSNISQRFLMTTLFQFHHFMNYDTPPHPLTLLVTASTKSAASKTDRCRRGHCLFFDTQVDGRVSSDLSSLFHLFSSYQEYLRSRGCFAPITAYTLSQYKRHLTPFNNCRQTFFPFLVYNVIY